MAKVRTAGKAKVAKAVGPGGQTPGVELVLGSEAAIPRKAKARKESTKAMARVVKERAKARAAKVKERKERKETRIGTGWTRIGAGCADRQDIGAMNVLIVAILLW